MHFSFLQTTPNVKNSHILAAKHVTLGKFENKNKKIQTFAYQLLYFLVKIVEKAQVTKAIKLQFKVPSASYKQRKF